MCRNNIKVVNRTKSGMIRQCSSCEKYNVTFNNVFLELTELELENFKKYLELTDIEYWENEYGIMNTKPIPIPTYQHNLILVFNRAEFEEFKDLLNFSEKFNYKSLSTKEIKNNFCYN
tara:strand:- start:5265 stop:5618 length:354 start_codon:yes stop_codon:yes gene_type:complete